MSIQKLKHIKLHNFCPNINLCDNCMHFTPLENRWENTNASLESPKHSFHLSPHCFSPFLHLFQALGRSELMKWVEIRHWLSETPLSMEWHSSPAAISMAPGSAVSPSLHTFPWDEKLGLMCTLLLLCFCVFSNNHYLTLASSSMQMFVPAHCALHRVMNGSMVSFLQMHFHS